MRISRRCGVFARRVLCGLLSVVVALPLLVGVAEPAAALASPVAPDTTGLTATAGDGAVLLSWDETSRNNIARDTAGWVYRQKEGSGSWSDEIEIDGGGPDTTSHLVTGLTNGVAYAFQVMSWLHSDGQERGPNSQPPVEVTATPTAVADAPKLVSVKRYAQATGQLGVVNHFTLFPALIWRLEFDRWVSYVRPSDFALTGTTAKVDLWNDWDPNHQPSFTDQKTAIYVVAHGGDLATVTGEVTLSVASHHNIHNISDNVNDIHNIRDDEKLYLSFNPVPTGANENTFTLDPAQTLVYFSQENFGVAEGDEAEVTVRLSRLRDEPTTIQVSATSLTATGNGVDYHGQTFSVTVPTWRATKTFKIRTTADTLTENDERFRLDIRASNLPAGVTLTTIPGSADQQTYVTIRDGDNSGGQGASQNAEQSSLSQPADEQASLQQTEQPCVSGSLVANVQGYAGETWRSSPDHVERWERVLAAFGQTGSYSANPMTAVEAQTYADRGWPRWVPVVAALECVETTPNEQPEQQPQAQRAQEPTPPPPVTPQVSIAAAADIAEGADATFTITATPAPASDLDVTVDVSQHGGYATAGSRTVTIGASGSATLTVATTDDSTDEPDGTVTATVNTGTGYTVSSSNSDATVTVSDDDVPHISIAADADVTEGDDAQFTITANPAPHAGLAVDVAITPSGDHGAVTGTRTVTIPASGTYTLTVATTDDSTDEPDGSVTATVNSGTGYTVSTTAGAATVAVSDDDDPPAEDTGDTSDTDTIDSGTSDSGTAPTVTVSDATAAEGAQSLAFVVTLSKPNPVPITFRYGGYGRTATLWQDWSIEFRRTFTLDAGETQVEIVVPIIDDDTPEDTETLRVYVYATSGIVIRSGFIYATGTITDND